ncbi:uncharacterized protein LOC120438311 isoform X2 [Oreochromis aureus]|uniref:uncharacterized protein LOC120438311 isoform X2 n=1 Tax=Oreochromis aureus TaxID=47969 RepID=UPI0019543957|nr:uncharacterized protein LOC120438311 isoform X2 [Oreochromis aureus]
MAAGTALLCCTLLFVHVFVSAGQRFMSRRILRVAVLRKSSTRRSSSQRTNTRPFSFPHIQKYQKNITAESGQDVTLTCRAPNNNIFAVEWSRGSLGDEYVFVYRKSHFDPEYQHPSFKNRVDLQDRQMKDGNVSFILKDVTINDTGTYKCLVYVEETKPRRLINIIHLTVDPPDKHTTTPPPTSTLPPVLSVLLPIGSVYVVVLLVLLVLLVRRCVHRKLEDGEDDITSSITYSVVKSSNHQQPPVKEARERETDSAVIYSAVRTEDVSHGQTTIRTRRLRYSCSLSVTVDRDKLAAHPVYRHHAKLS